MASKEKGNTGRTVDIDPIWERFANAGVGHFEALVRLSDNYRPDYMKILGPFTKGVFKAELPATALPRLAHDDKILSVELREYKGA